MSPTPTAPSPVPRSRSGRHRRVRHRRHSPSRRLLGLPQRSPWLIKLRARAKLRIILRCLLRLGLGRRSGGTVDEVGVGARGKPAACGSTAGASAPAAQGSLASDQSSRPCSVIPARLSFDRCARRSRDEGDHQIPTRATGARPAALCLRTLAGHPRWDALCGEISLPCLSSPPSASRTKST